MSERKRIEVSDVSVRYGSKIALDIKQTLVIQEGDIVGIIGENGAGKTTLVRALLQQIPFMGKIFCDYEKNEIGVMFQTNAYNPLMRVYELIRIIAGVRHFDAQLQELLHTFQMDTIFKTKIGNLSGGEQQRLTLALMLYKRPSLLIFDEMTTGLDFEKR